MAHELYTERVVHFLQVVDPAGPPETVRET